MEWKNLKDGKCPKCGKMLVQSGLGTGSIPALRCIDTKSKKCDFKISEKRLMEIISSKKRPHRELSQEERDSELNNYGRQPMSEDFSDSYPNS